MTPQEKKLDDTNKRQKAYYQRNKDKIKKMKQDDRDMVKALKLKDAPRDVLVEYPIDKIIEIFKKFIQNERTVGKYTANMKLAFRLCSIEKFVANDKTYDLINEKIGNSTYSLSTKKSTIQSVLVFLAHSHMKITDKLKKKYADLWAVYDIKTRDEAKNKTTDAKYAIMDYDVYMNMIRENYGENHKATLISHLYNECPARDNFHLKIIQSMNEDNGKINYLLQNGDSYKILLNDYKTKNLYNKITYDLSPVLSKLLTEYIDKNDDKTYLFPENKNGSLSNYIGKMNLSVGVTGAINTLRKMKVSQYLALPCITEQDRLDFSRKMAHSTTTQQDIYKRIITPQHLGNV
jgi:hypothetical protein